MSHGADDVSPRADATQHRFNNSSDRTADATISDGWECAQSYPTLPVVLPSFLKKCGRADSDTVASGAESPSMTSIGGAAVLLTTLTGGLSVQTPSTPLTISSINVPPPSTTTESLPPTSSVASSISIPATTSIETLSATTATSLESPTSPVPPSTSSSTTIASDSSVSLTESVSISTLFTSTSLTSIPSPSSSVEESLPPTSVSSSSTSSSSSDTATNTSSSSSTSTSTSSSSSSSTSSSPSSSSSSSSSSTISSSTTSSQTTPSSTTSSSITLTTSSSLFSTTSSTESSSIPTSSSSLPSSSIPTSIPTLTTSSTVSTSSLPFSSSQPPLSSEPSSSLPSSSFLTFSIPTSSSSILSLSPSFSIPSTQVPVVFTSTIFTTRFFTTRLPEGHTTTITTVIASGVLSTSIPSDDNAFSHNTGAIVGVAVAATFTVIMVVIFTFFACRRYKARRAREGLLEQAMRFSPEPTWRPPLDGDDDDDDDNFYAGQHGSLVAALQHAPPPMFPEGELQRDEMSNGHSSTSHSGGHGASSVESTIPPPSRTASLGRQRMAGFGQAAETMAIVDRNGNVSPSLSLSPSASGSPHIVMLPRRGSSGGPEPSLWLGGRSDTSSPSNYSSTSLNQYPSSSHGHGAGSSSSGHGLTMGMGRKLTPPDKPSKSLTKQTSRTAPTSYRSKRRSTDKSSLNSEHTDSKIRGLLERFRSAASPVPDVVVRSATPGSQHSHRSHSPSYYQQSPSSLLNPGPPPALHPRPMSDPVHGSLVERNYKRASEPEVLWPPATLPSLTVPGDSHTFEGLLHPRLMSFPVSENSSTASLRDNVDYSRPIGGLVNNRLHSTTTFNTQETAEGTTLDGSESIRNIS